MKQIYKRRTKRSRKATITIIIIIIIDCYINTMLELISIRFNGGTMHRDLQLLFKIHFIQVLICKV